MMPFPKVAHIVIKKMLKLNFFLLEQFPLILKNANAEIDEIAQQGYWTPVSQSKWATPLVPVPKKDGGVRICGNTVFSKIYLKTAFQQLELDGASKELCTVNTNKWIFKVNRLYFGVASSPALWQRDIDSILKDLPGVYCFVDDILVAAKTELEHLNLLMLVFKRLHDNDVHIKPEKCVFLTKEISYLVFEINDKGLFRTWWQLKKVQRQLTCLRYEVS